MMEGWTGRINSTSYNGAGIRLDCKNTMVRKTNFCPHGITIYISETENKYN